MCIYTVYEHVFGDFPTIVTVYAPYIYGSGQPYTHYTHTKNYVYHYVDICTQGSLQKVGC